jgi:hypothetical protein
MDINIGKLNETVDVDVDRLSAEVMTYVVRYGLTQILNDAHSSVTEKAYPDADEREEAVHGLVHKKLDALYSGEIRVNAVRGDAVQRMALDMAEKIAKDIWRKSGKKVTDVDAKGWRAKAEIVLEKKPELLDRAKARIAEDAAETVDDIEL